MIIRILVLGLPKEKSGRDTADNDNHACQLRTTLSQTYFLKINEFIEGDHHITAEIAIELYI